MKIKKIVSETAVLLKFHIQYLNILSLSNGHQLPNILSSLRPPKLLGDFLCGKCKKKNCFNHFHSEPWEGYHIPVEVDEALDEVNILLY